MDGRMGGLVKFVSDPLDKFLSGYTVALGERSGQLCEKRDIRFHKKYGYYVIVDDDVMYVTTWVGIPLQYYRFVPLSVKAKWILTGK